MRPRLLSSVRARLGRRRLAGSYTVGPFTRVAGTVNKGAVSGWSDADKAAYLSGYTPADRPAPGAAADLAAIGEAAAAQVGAAPGRPARPARPARREPRRA